MRYFCAWDGRPENPERSGWHWVDDADGLRPLLWRGEDWPERVDQGEWQDGYTVLSIGDLKGWFYYGPIAMPPDLEKVFSERVRDEII